MEDRPQLTRAHTIHDIAVQNREQSEELERAHKLLRKVESDITRRSPTVARNSPKLSRKKSELLLVELEEAAPLVRSPGYQRDLNIIVKMIKDQQYFKDPKTLKRLNKLLKPTIVVPTMAEMINIIYRTEKFEDIVKYVTSQDPTLWTQEAAHALVYDTNEALRPEALITSYLICKKLLKNETPETILREENLISRLIYVWMPPIKFTVRWGNRRQMAVKMLRSSFKHLISAAPEFHRNLQKQICEQKLQSKNTPPILYISIFLRYYVPQFISQTNELGTSKLAQAYINGSENADYQEDLQYLHDKKSLQELAAKAKTLFVC